MKTANQYKDQQMNRINKLFLDKPGNILSVYFTAGYPLLDSTAGIIRYLAEAGADMIEIGIPFSDPLADGPVIQQSNTMALRNGMTLKLLFRQIGEIRKKVNTPLLMMGYLNPVLQYGVENFCRQCHETGIDGAIIPDLPPEVFLGEYQDIFSKYGLHKIFLISPRSDDERIRMIDNMSNGFIYMVSSSSTTGMKDEFSGEQISYFERIRGMKLFNKCLIGFGISNNKSFSIACNHANGAIIGSAFVKKAGEKDFGYQAIIEFVKGIRGE
jgi:tryptophan synthase alpha chain